MSKETMETSIEELFHSSAEGLKDKLPGALEEIQKYGLEKWVAEHPDFLARLLNKLKQTDAAKLFSALPNAADKFMDLFWEGISFRAGQSQGMKAVLEKAERDLHVNMEASDSPFQSHFIVKDGRLTGRSGLLHFRDEDFRFMGPTEVLLELLTGDLALGFSNLRLQTAGHSGWVSRISPVIKEIHKLIRGS